jgi:predicted RNA binding protein YcfA (HicA-like mRNA interferase family)
MPELSGFSGRDIIKILGKIGFIYLRTHGSHAVLKKIHQYVIVVIIGLTRPLLLTNKHLITTSKITV